MPDLDPQLRFETFVVGPANRLASAAARRAAESPGTSYNPLFIYSASGLGKSHILSAIAHHAQKSEAAERIRYEPLEDYLEELTQSLEAGEREVLRDRFRELDLLLLDDVQFLTGQPEAQEMLLSTMDALTGGGSQVVLASDRPPAEINGLDTRLVSRFSGGLIVDIGAPQYETRVAIVERKTEEAGQTLEEGVSEAIGRFPFNNVRELNGALNRVLAIQDLEGRQVSKEEVVKILGVVGGRAGAEGDDYATFLDEISADLAHAVERTEEEWRRGMREASEAAEREGFSAGRMRGFLEAESEPEGWRDILAGFGEDLARLRAIEQELDRLKNPWPELADDLIRDPDRLDEAESFLQSVQERQRPFGVLGPGPNLSGLGDVVSPLAIKAADQLVSGEKAKYNPLYLWARNTDAPHAVLGATARTFRRDNPDLAMALTSVSAFAQDFIRALASGVAGAWRERWWTLDLLLIHDAEALSETERVQDEFFHLFEALKRRGSRIMLTGDRPPGEIDEIDERLRSRFEGGLVLEVEGEEVPAELSDLTLYDPTGLPAEMLAGNGAEAVARAALAAGQGSRDGSASSEEPSAEAADSAVPVGDWSSSREKVVWQWSDLSDRLVENLE